MEGCFMFQWGWGLHFEKGGMPHGVIRFDGGGLKKMLEGGGVPPPCPPPTMGNPEAYIRSLVQHF